MMLYTVAVIVVLLFALATQMFKVLREYERGVVFFLVDFKKSKTWFDHPYPIYSANGEG